MMRAFALSAVTASDATTTTSHQSSSVRLCGRIDPCASEEGVKGLRALGVRVPGPGRALARDGRSDVGRTDGRKGTEDVKCITNLKLLRNMHKPGKLAWKYSG